MEPLDDEMKKKNSTDTKTKIMEVAFELFGRYGVEGTSVREISKRSKVNLAAINYHFESKENLFWNIMYETFKEVNADIKAMSAKTNDIYQLSEMVFDYFVEEKMALKNTMKMMLMEGVGEPQSEEIKSVLDSPMGPPGGEFFAEKILKSVSYPLSPEGIMWGVKATYGSVMHWALMTCAEPICAKAANDELMGEKQIKKDVQRMVQATILFLDKNPELFRLKN
jgi:AcrR family transcriptional regulator